MNKIFDLWETNADYNQEVTKINTKNLDLSFGGRANENILEDVLTGGGFNTFNYKILFWDCYEDFICAFCFFYQFFPFYLDKNKKGYTIIPCYDYYGKHYPDIFPYNLKNYPCDITFSTVLSKTNSLLKTVPMKELLPLYPAVKSLSLGSNFSKDHYIFPVENIEVKNIRHKTMLWMYHHYGYAPNYPVFEKIFLCSSVFDDLGRVKCPSMFYSPFFAPLSTKINQTEPIWFSANIRPWADPNTGIPFATIVEDLKKYWKYTPHLEFNLCLFLEKLAGVLNEGKLNLDDEISYDKETPPWLQERCLKLFKE
jgi:hypothetical protein